jgi:hypothetical protein
MSNEEIIELIKDAAFFGGTIKDTDVEECKALLDNLALTIPNVVVDLPSKKSKEFERWTQSKGYEPAFNGLWYEKNNQTYNTDLLHRAFTNEIEFGN